jgi:hypothetical protein
VCSPFWYKLVGKHKKKSIFAHHNLNSIEMKRLLQLLLLALPLLSNAQNVPFKPTELIGEELTIENIAE